MVFIFAPQSLVVERSLAIQEGGCCGLQSVVLSIDEQEV